MKHTPGPWSIIPDSLDIIAKPQTGLRGRFIAQVLESFTREEGELIDAVFVKEDLEAPANAQFIVTACNAHADLLEVLKALNAWVGVRLGYEYDEDPIAESVHNAIAKAEGRE